MKVCIATNWDNGKGLQRDAEVLRGALQRRGHDVVLAHTERDITAPASDLLIFLESVRPSMFPSAPRRWVVPNPEWWAPEWDAHLDAFERVLCKTRDAHRIFERLVGHRARFTGWLAEDRMDATVARERAFLHVAGGSTAKGTTAVMAAWESDAPGPLTVVSSVWRGRAARGVKVIRHATDTELRRLQNSHLFHLQPSEYEGFGHAVWEGLSVGAVMAVTDAPPLDEITSAAAHIPSETTRTLRAATLSQVGAAGVRQAARDMLALSPDRIEVVRQSAREEYLAMVETFERSLDELMAPSAPRIAICFPAHVSNAPVLLRSIQALRAQDCDPALFEVCIGWDGGVTPGDPVDDAIMAPFGRSVLPFAVTMMNAPRPRGDVPHRNHARNAAWRIARAPLVMILDADFILPPNFVAHVLAEHDAALARGRPAVFSPCLAGIGGVGPGDWISRSAAWAADGDPTLLAGLVAAHSTDVGIYSGFPDRHTDPAVPASAPLGDLLEGMPVLWRGLLESLDGFDESFGEWGGDKEEFIDRLKGCARAGLFEIRLLTSVMALHQPHERDPGATSPDARKRQRERERRARLITTNAAWWRSRIDRVRETIGAAIDAARPDFIPTAFAAPGSPSGTGTGIDGESLSAPRPHVSALAHEVARHFQGKSQRSSVMSVAVAGHRFAPDVIAALSGIGMNVRGYSVADVLAAPAKSTPWLAAIDILSSAPDDAAFAAMGESIRRAVGPRGYVCLVERCRSGGHQSTRKYRPPMDFQRAITGIGPVGAPFAIDGEWFTVFTGRVVR